MQILQFLNILSPDSGVYLKTFLHQCIFTLKTSSWAFRTCTKIIIICKNRLEKWMKNRFYYRKKKKAKKITTKERLLKGCSCREKSARLAGICLAKELSLQVRYFLLLFKKARKSFPANRGSFYHIKEKKFSC